MWNVVKPFNTTRQAEAENTTTVKKYQSIIGEPVGKQEA